MNIGGRSMACWLAAIWIVVYSGVNPPAAAADGEVDIYVFWAEGCPHCGNVLAFLDTWRKQQPRARVHRLEVSAELRNREAFEAVVRYFGIERPGVPLTVIGEAYLLGYHADATTGAAIRHAALQCLERPCRDIVRPLLAGIGVARSGEASNQSSGVPSTLLLPLVGELSIAHTSLPWLTVMLAAVDGFNPCAMWTLVFLIGLLVGLRDRFRMWVLGGAFIVASAGVYYVFMAAWLNLLLFLGMLLWVRLLVAGLAMGGGAYYLHEYFANPEMVCKVTAPESRRRVFDRLRALASERRFLIALIGIVLLAFAVNLVELICSAGIPAVYTQVLALSRLPVWQYHAYLALYVLVFLLDDLIVFFVAMKTLQVTGLTGSYVRHAHAMGGALLIVIGLLLLFKPEWLTFAV